MLRLTILVGSSHQRYATPVFASTNKDNTTLTSVTFAENSVLTEIADNVFARCTKITALDIPETVTKIGAGAFARCESLEGLVIPASVTSGVKEMLGFGAIQGEGDRYPHSAEVTFASGSPYSIEDGVLYKGTVLEALLNTEATSVTVKEGTTEIGVKAFYNTELTSVTVPNSVKEIGKEAFWGTNITSIDLSGAESIGDNAFKGCAKLESATLSDDIHTIGLAAFEECKKLDLEKLPENLKVLGKKAFRNCASLTSAVIPSGVTEISEQAFFGCLSLERIELSDGITSIGKHAFYLTIKQDGKFVNPNPKLESINIPASVTSVGQNFLGGVKADGQTALIFEGTTPPTFANGALSGISGNDVNKPTVYYPAEAEDKYAGADSALVESGLVSTPSEESEPDNQYALSITEDTASVEVGKTVQLTVTSIVPTDATLEWSSSNEQVATVVKGTITGVKAGSATITASIQLNGITLVSDTCVVTVSEVPPSTGGDSYEPSTPSGDYLVSVDKTTGGKVTVNPGRADKGDTVTITVKPDKGYELDELTVTAKNGDTVKLTEKSNGKFTFKMPGSKVTVEAVFVKENGEQPVVTLPFADVNKGDWFYDAVEYVYGNDLMNGTSATAFSPYLTTSRAMMLTMLARYDGVDTTTGSTWYEAGAVWAVAEGISDGTNLEADLTREQLVTMLWRYTGSPVVESDLSAYPDGGAVSDWAVNAMIWATQTGVITGNGAGALAPQGTATRAEVATILARFCAGK